MCANLTIDDVLYFLNEIDFTDDLDNDKREKITQAKRSVVKQFESTCQKTVIEVLKILDVIELS